MIEFKKGRGEEFEGQEAKRGGGVFISGTLRK
jgi:hypothetical protein